MNKKILIGAAAAAALFYLLGRRNREQKGTKQTNNEIAQNTLESTQAQIFYKGFNIEKTLGKYHVSLVKLPDQTQLKNIFNAANNIINLSSLQNSFSNLTDKTLTLNTVTTETLSTDLYAEFWKFAKGQKVVTTEKTERTNPAKIPSIPTPVEKNTILGLYLGSINNAGVMYYRFAYNITVAKFEKNSFTGKYNAEITYSIDLVPKDKCKLVTP